MHKLQTKAKQAAKMLVELYNLIISFYDSSLICKDLIDIIRNE